MTPGQFKERGDLGARGAKYKSKTGSLWPLGVGSEGNCGMKTGGAPDCGVERAAVDGRLSSRRRGLMVVVRGSVPLKLAEVGG
jgi:hypothetical protein